MFLLKAAQDQCMFIINVKILISINGDTGLLIKMRMAVMNTLKIQTGAEETMLTQTSIP